ncbi:MAG: hypothetical protein NTW95_10540 [Candidatus Aminicenantes bacterium]|nr:hypothetical protein [Candidatus Aminicenantes bacterium]
MKRFFFWLFLLLGFFGLLFVGLNLFDSRFGPLPAKGTEPAASLEAGNGFFILWGFAAGAGSDPQVPAFQKEIRALVDAPAGTGSPRLRYGQWLARLNAAFRGEWQGGANLYVPQLPAEDLCAYFASRRDAIQEQRLRLAVPLQRYEQVVRAAELADFTPLGWEFPARSFLLATHAAKLFAASRIVAAIDGGWLPACADLFSAQAAGFKLIASGRTLMVNRLGKTMVELTLRALAALLNRRDCPPVVARLVLDQLPVRPVREFGTQAARDFAWMSFGRALERVQEEKVIDPSLLKDYFREPARFFALERFVAISGPRFFATIHALAAFFLKKNESTAALHAFWDHVGRLEETPPALWMEGPRPAAHLAADLDGGPFWWLRNPLGKMMVRSAVPFTWPVLQHYVYRSHGLKVRYDLTRLLAMARLKAEPGGSLSRAALHDLLATAPEQDPFSGKPYLFNPESGMLYGVGPDGKDDSGRELPTAWKDSDIAVPINFIKRD